MPTARASLLGSVIVIAAATLFGALGVTSRFAYDAGLQPFAFVAWRAGVGALGIALVVAATRHPGPGWASLGSASPEGRRALLVAVFLAAGVNLSVFLSFERTTIALALLGFYTYPAMVAAGSSLLGRERLDLARVIALALALVGMAAVVLGGLGSATAVRLDALGIGLGLAAAGFQTTFILTSRGYAGIPADIAMGTILAGSALAAAIISVASGGIAALAMPLGDPSLLALLLGVGLFAAALPSVMFLTGIRWIGPVRTGILMLFEPVVGVALGALLLAEGLAPLQVLGGATILLAALLVQRGSAGREDSPAVVPVPGGP
jgi:drug/metabolite transporter (DMT)-like permease